MTIRARRTRRTSALSVALTTAGIAAGGLLIFAPCVSADDVGYLVNVTVRPGYNFANSDQALAYGRGICDKIAADVAYSRLIFDVKADLHTSDEYHHTSDEYQASYLINQAAQELCPEMIWQLRNSAARYTG